MLSTDLTWAAVGPAICGNVVEVTPARSSCSVLRRWAEPLLDLALPTACVICGRAGELWCAECRPEPGAIAVPTSESVWAGASYADEVRTALLTFKERGRPALADPLADYVVPAVEEAGIAQPILVPVPSSRVVARQRGGSHTLRLARAVASKTDGFVLPVLRLRGPVADSAGLDPRQRQANLTGRFVADRPGRAVRRLSAVAAGVLILDDIVTTGASMREAVRALTAAGWPVAGGVVVAATQLRQQQSTADSWLFGVERTPLGH